MQNEIGRNKKILLWILPPLLFVVGILFTLFSPLRYTALVEPSVRDIDPKAIFELIEKNPDRYLLIDVRGSADYKKIHAKHAINIPIHLLYEERKNLRQSGKEIVLMCTGGKLAGVAYSYLEHYGFQNISRVDGGIENWQTQNLPIVMEDLFR